MVKNVLKLWIISEILESLNLIENNAMKLNKDFYVLWKINGKVLAKIIKKARKIEGEIDFCKFILFILSESKGYLQLRSFSFDRPYQKFLTSLFVL